MASSLIGWDAAQLLKLSVSLCHFHTSKSIKLPYSYGDSVGAVLNISYQPPTLAPCIVSVSPIHLEAFITEVLSELNWLISGTPDCIYLAIFCTP